MDRAQQLEVFKAQVKNVRELEQAWRQLRLSINSDLVSQKYTSAKIHTKTLALVYCAWSEAVFSKLIHTPHGFELDEISQIKSAQRSSIVDAWKKCIELALSKVGSRNGNYLPNIRKRLERLVETYISSPSLVRNKIAHGQWVSALNRDNTNINQDLSLEINTLDIVKLDILRNSFLGLSQIVEAMIESPDRTFHRDYWPLITAIEDQLAKTARYSLSDKIALLQAKAARKRKRTSTPA